MPAIYIIHYSPLLALAAGYTLQHFTHCLNDFWLWQQWRVEAQNRCRKTSISLTNIYTYTIHTYIYINFFTNTSFRFSLLLSIIILAAVILIQLFHQHNRQHSIAPHEPTTKTADVTAVNASMHIFTFSYRLFSAYLQPLQRHVATIIIMYTSANLEVNKRENALN